MPASLKMHDSVWLCGLHQQDSTTKESMNNAKEQLNEHILNSTNIFNSVQELNGISVLCAIGI
jgi:hypothetical protein